MTSIAALPFFGGELSAFSPSDAYCNESTDTTTFDATYSRASIVCSNRYTTATSPTWSSASPFWFHGSARFSQRTGGGQPNNNCLLFYNGATLIAQLLVSYPAGNQWHWSSLTLSTLQNGVMTAVATGQVSNDLVEQIDINLVGGASGSAALYTANALVGSATGLNHTAWAGVTSMAIIATDDNNFGIVTTNYWSQIICDTVCTIGRNVWTDNFTNESATNTGWSVYGGGTKLANVNKIVYDDSTGITSSTTGQTDTFYQSGQSFGTYNVLARGVSSRSSYAGTAPTQVKLTVRVSSTNYVSSAVALTTAYQPAFNPWTTNPNTSAAWTASNAAGIEAGVQSLT